jgi:hypothetical protein
MGSDQTVPRQQMAATALLWRQNHPLVLGVEYQVTNLASKHLFDFNEIDYRVDSSEMRAKG